MNTITTTHLYGVALIYTLLEKTLFLILLSLKPYLTILSVILDLSLTTPLLIRRNLSVIFWNLDIIYPLISITLTPLLTQPSMEFVPCSPLRIWGPFLSSWKAATLWSQICWISCVTVSIWFLSENALTMRLFRGCGELNAVREAGSVSDNFLHVFRVELGFFCHSMWCLGIWRIRCLI